MEKVTIYDSDIISTKWKKISDNRVNYLSRYGETYREFGTKEELDQFLTTGRVEYMAPQKVKRIEIMSGKDWESDENWTERKTRERTLSHKIFGYHFGFVGKNLIASGKETCFYFSWPNGKNFVPAGAIVVEIPAGTRIDEYDDEFRVAIQDGWRAWSLKKGFLRISK